MTDQEDQNTQPSIGNGDLIDSVRELITMMKSNGIGKIDLKTGNVSIKLQSAVSAPVQAAASTVIQTDQVGMAAQVEVEDEGNVITAPMIGTFYSAPAPGEAPFVRIGDEVEVGQVIGIIEAMKIMNEIVADYSGTVAEILVENAQPVEYGSPLIRVTQADELG